MNPWMATARPRAIATITTSSATERASGFLVFVTPTRRPSLALPRPRRSRQRWLRARVHRCLQRRLRAGRLGLGGDGIGGGRLRGLGRGLLRLDSLGDRLLRGGALGIHRRGLAVAVGPVEQLALDGHLGSGGPALAHAGALADPAAQVVELGATHVAAGRHLDPLDLRGVQRERPLHADAEGLLADGERLPGAMALALDHDALEHLGAAPRALDDLEVHAQTVTGVERGDPAELRSLQAFDDCAHGN